MTVLRPTSPPARRWFVSLPSRQAPLTLMLPLMLTLMLALAACSSAPPLRLYRPDLPPAFANAPGPVAQSMNAPSAIAPPATAPVATAPLATVPSTSVPSTAAAAPAAPVPPTSAPPAAAAAPNTESQSRFWQGFHDPLLDSLMQRALAANTDLRTAVARLNEVRALARAAQADLLPSLDFAAGASRVRPKNDQGMPQTDHVYSVGVDVLWEADLFGRLGDARRAALAEVRAGEAGIDAARLSVSAALARSYFELRGLQEQLRVARASMETQSQVLELVAAREDAGRGTALDTERARALLASTASDVPALESALIATRYRLAVLCAVQPTALDAELEAVRPLPGLAPTRLANIGAPAALLRRRPDIRVAEAQAAAAAARVGVARSALFPALTLGGSLGQNALSLGELGRGVSYAYNLGAQLTWNLLDFGRIRARIAAFDARNEAAMITYEYTVLAALAETEGALADYTRRQRQAALLFEATRASTQAALIARERFRVGSTDFLTALDAERELLGARNRLAQAQTSAAVSLVAVYKALAGGWEPP